MRLPLCLLLMSAACAPARPAATSATGCVGDRTSVVANGGPYDVDIVGRLLSGRSVILGAVAAGERREFALEPEVRNVSWVVSRNVRVQTAPNVEVRYTCRPRSVTGVTGTP